MSGGDQRPRRHRRARVETAAAVDGGHGPGGGEREIIEREPVSRDARHALWLWACATSERRQIRQWARDWER